MLTMTHPDVGTAACASLDQFELVWEPKGWQLAVGDDGDLVADRSGGVPTNHLDRTPITADEVAAAEAEAAAAPSDPVADAPADDLDPVDLDPVDITRPTTDGAAVDHPESEED